MLSLNFFVFVVAEHSSDVRPGLLGHWVSVYLSVMSCTCLLKCSSVFLSYMCQIHL